RSGLIPQRLEARATFAEGFRVSKPDAPRQAARE
ncbi:MAG TPA: aliphatic sulfonates ABC transporter substrate-binding protein, partial [Pseudomonas sp.]|nr:aliphatic sulfonates ABC transporter substrate-binding protein [Pseudomonas sp.]